MKKHDLSSTAVPAIHSPITEQTDVATASNLPSEVPAIKVVEIIESDASEPVNTTSAIGGAHDGTDPFAAVSAAEAMTLSLTPPQQKAIRLLTSGHTLVASATAAGVNRTTLYRWLKGDAAFLAAFNAWQKDVLDTTRGRILALSDLAVNTVAKAMTRGDATIALKILGSIGAMDRIAPGSTDPDEIERVQKLERMKTKTALRQAENRAEMESYLQ